MAMLIKPGITSTKYTLIWAACGSQLRALKCFYVSKFLFWNKPETSNYFEIQVSMHSTDQCVLRHVPIVDKLLDINTSPLTPNEHILRSSLIWQSCVSTSYFLEEGEFWLQFLQKEANQKKSTSSKSFKPKWTMTDRCRFASWE